jgi:hypothetical protein
MRRRARMVFVYICTLNAHLAALPGLSACPAASVSARCPAAPPVPVWLIGWGGGQRRDCDLVGDGAAALALGIGCTSRGRAAELRGSAAIPGRGRYFLGFANTRMRGRLDVWTVRAMMACCACCLQGRPASRACFHQRMCVVAAQSSVQGLLHGL